MNIHPVERAATVIGSQAALASALGVTRAAVGQWRLPGRRVPAEHCPAIEKMTRDLGDAVTCEELRPDIQWSVLRERAQATAHPAAEEQMRDVASVSPHAA